LALKEPDMNNPGCNRGYMAPLNYQLWRSWICCKILW